MFRDNEQRMLVIQTLLGVVGHADWVEGEEYSARGQEMLTEYNAPESVAGAIYMHGETEEFFIRLALSISKSGIPVFFWRRLNACDYPRRRVVVSLIEAVFGSGDKEDRAPIDFWLAMYEPCRSNISGHIR